LGEGHRDEPANRNGSSSFSPIWEAYQITHDGCKTLKEETKVKECRAVFKDQIDRIKSYEVGIFEGISISRRQSSGLHGSDGNCFDSVNTLSLRIKAEFNP
jgi:hypothetical protein